MQFRVRLLFQGDHGDYNKTAAKMSLETSARVSDWIESPSSIAWAQESLVLTFFGGEPPAGLPVVCAMAERAWLATQARGTELYINVITNGLR